MIDRASIQLDDYLQGFRARLERMHLVRALGAIALSCLLLTVAGVLVAIQNGFSATVVNITRVALVAAVVALVLVLLVLPWRRLRRQPAHDIEALTPTFQGRVETWLGMRAESNPLQELLAEDTLTIAQRHPPEGQVRPWMITVPAAVAAVCAAVLLWLGVAGPGLVGYGVRHVWAGWAVDGLLPQQGILVTPGNQVVRRGGSVPVLAQVQGFNPANAQIHALIGNGAWQAVEMTRSARGFEFTLLSVREPVRYYVSAGGVQSASYAVEVVEVPTVENLKLVYDYPQWTRRKDRTDDPGGDVSAVAGTQVQLEVKTDRPMGDGLLVINGKDARLDASGNLARGGFPVSEDGRYYIAARVGNETVRLTDDYLIKVLPDAKPEIRIAKPGRDASASSIEEVTARVAASDDFALEKVELRYAVNGGEWQTVPIPAGGERVDATRVLMLEEMRSATEDRPLAAGDLISYYATARDRAQTVQTDMYFVEVRPFDRRYSEGQEGGGGGGGGGGGDEQSEISKRQKEILVSTWNLIRQRADQQSGSAATVRDNSLLLADAQKKLAEQAEALATRAQSRELTSSDPRIKQFIQHMQDAAKSMQPAAQRLAAVDLEKAIQPEQLALQYLLRAEAAFTDVEVSRQRNADGGSGRSSRDLAQLYELEMDLEKNQYESGSSASPEQSGEQLDELGRKLQELARRQEQLANEARRQQQQLTDEQRWQQESLRREAEQLQRQLQEQQANNSQSGQSGQAGESGQSGQAGQAGQQLQQAIAAMNRAGEAMRSGNDQQQREQLQRAASEASRQLASASRQISQQRQQAIASELGDLARQAEELHAQQVAIEQQLQEAASAAARSQNRTDTSAGLSTTQRSEIAGQKREMSQQVQRMEQDLAESARRMRGEAPGTADSLLEAGQMLSVNQVQSLLTTGAQYVERGLGAFVVPRESGITETLREVRDELRAAQSQEGGGTTQGQRNDRALADALARVQSLREQVQQLANANAAAQNQPGQQGGAQPGNSPQGSEGSQGGEQPGNSPQGGQGSQGGSQPGSNPQGGQGAQGGEALGSGGGIAGVRRALVDAGRQAGGLVPIIAGSGGNAQSAEAVRDLARQLQAVNLNGTGDQLNRQLTGSLTLLEQLELQLAQSARGNARGSVRTAVAEPVADQYRDAVAEYYRQLSED